MQWKSSVSDRPKSCSAFSDIGIILLWKFHNKIMNACPLCSCNNLFIRSSRFSICNIIPDCTVKQIDILLYSSDIISETLQSQAADIFSINSDPSLCYIIKAWQKRTDSSFPPPDGPTSATDFPAGISIEISLRTGVLSSL